MGSRSKQEKRCLRCRMHDALCICDFIPRYDLDTRVILVMHRREWAKTTATGPLALQSLPNGEVRIHGHRDRPLDFSNLKSEERRTLLLYPADDAAILDTPLLEQDRRAVTLVVPDGSWRQAARMGRRLPGLEHAEMVRLPEGSPTRWGIRREQHLHGLATFEAIARALGIIESPAVQSGMEDLFQLMVRRTISSRGAGGNSAAAFQEAALHQP